MNDCWFKIIIIIENSKNSL